MKTNDVIGLGNALMDFLVEIDEEHLLEMDLKKGEFHLVDAERTKEVLEKIKQSELKVEIVPGGSAANTLKGVALLGGKAILCGKVGNDGHGEVYVQEISQMGVVPRLNKHGSTTGHAVTFITPDTERTFSVHLGAAVELYKEDVLEEDISKSKILHLEGYQLEGPTKDTVLHAIELAKKHHTLVSIDLADPGVVRRNKDFFMELVKNYADIVFVNENEAKELLGLDNEEEAVKELGKFCQIAIVKIGKQGSLVYTNSVMTKVDGCPAKAIDTTGAGDSYAAGFLYGYCQGWGLLEAGKLGSLLAARVVEQVGVGMKDIDGNELKKIILNKNDEEKKVKIGIIGGSGLDNPEIIHDVKDLEVETPFGKPSSSLKVGKISGTDVVLLARHGREHTIPPTQVNNQANIQALKDVGCTHIIATTACGSLREEIGRGDFVVLDQFIDFTRHRTISFHDQFAPGKMVHTPMAEPFDKNLRNVMIETCQNLGLKHHHKGTVVTIEGPRFSTKAESHMFRAWGADVINMSIAPEVTLANELGIPYAAIAMSTDYDCWKEGEEAVTWEEVLKVFKENVEKVTNLLTNIIPKISGVNETVENVKVETDNKENVEFDLKSTIRTIPHWPKHGVMFRDITSLLENPEAFNFAIKKLKERYQGKNITKVAGIESRGFIFGAVLAKELGLPFVLIRKPGKLPGETVSQEYQLEYGTDKIEMLKSSLNVGDHVLVVDDLLATAGTALAACSLVEKVGGKVFGVAVVIDLPDLKGAEKLSKYELFKLVEFEGD